MSTNTITYVAIGSFIALPLLYLIVRKAKTDGPSCLLGNKTAAAIPLAPISFVDSGPVLGKKRKGHRGGKKANKTKSHEVVTKAGSKPQAEAVIEQEFTDSVASSGNERLHVAFLISTSKWMAGQYPESMEADVKESQPTNEEDGWETVGQKGKAVKKGSGRREEILVAAPEEQIAKTIEIEDECTLVHPIEQVNSKKKAGLTIDAYEASIHSTSSTASEFGKENSIQFTAENNIASDEDSHPPTPISPTSSLAEQQELAMAVKASLAESNNGWETVGPRRRSNRRATSSSA